MLALAGYPMGMRCVTLDPSASSPAAQVAPSLVGAYEDRALLAELAERSDVITYEFENVPVEAARFAQTLRPVFPPPESLEVAQDRLEEKRLFERVGLDVPAFEPVGSLDHLTDAVSRIGTPAVLKSRRLGYDGKGQTVIEDPATAEAAWQSIGRVPALLESFVRFDRELSLVAVRGDDGATLAYPLVENHHRDGILRLTLAPAPGLDPRLQRAAEDVARSIMDAIGHVGVVAIELFQVGDRLLGNEMAPRVHNSGHWTDVGARTSQFENHLRAIGGLALGSTDAIGSSAMVNLVGSMPDVAALAAVPGAHLHDYGKEPRPGRKLGHVTVCADDLATLDVQLSQVQALAGG
jgi:5-(carboxyamino)imidazole ribonucleotide synthase